MRQPGVGTSHTDDGAPKPVISLLDADERFASAVSAADAALARRVLTLPRIDVPVGGWQPPSRKTWRGPVSGFLVASGALARHVEVSSRSATEFLGPGDVVQPWAGTGDVLPCKTTWTAPESTVLAVLDGRFTLASSKWPALGCLLHERLADQLHRAAAHTAISHLPRVEQRILAVLWQLADRFGTVGPEGVDVRLRLTHAVIGDCVGARRPTVTLALRVLMDEGLVQRRETGTWLLSRESREVVRSGMEPAPVAVPAQPVAA